MLELSATPTGFEGEKTADQRASTCNEIIRLGFTELRLTRLEVVDAVRSSLQLILLAISEGDVRQAGTRMEELIEAVSDQALVGGL